MEARTTIVGKNVKATDSSQTVSPETPGAERQAATHAGRHHSPELILIVDDDQNIRDSLAEVLRAENYAVRLAGDGHEAVRQFLLGPPDLILLDLNMPKFDGWQAFQIIAELYPYVAVIVITARPHQGARAAAAGIDLVMEKPLDIPLLIENVRKLLAQPNPPGCARAIRAWPTEDQPDSQG